MEKKDMTCDSCGSTLRLAEGGGRAVCPYCGRVYLLQSETQTGVSGILSRLQERAGAVAANFGLGQQRAVSDAFGEDGAEEERRFLAGAEPQSGTLERFRASNGGEAVRVPDRFTAIGKKAAYKDALVGRISFAPNVHKIGKKAFARCAQLARVRLEGVQSLGAKAFFGCGALREVTFCTFVPEIGKKVFARCPRIARVILPRSMEGSISRLFGKFAKFRIEFIFFEN